jgi:NTE family protein
MGNRMPRAAVILGGGAPNGALMAGALAGLYDSGKTFNEFYTSGAGAMIGLTYLAGRGHNPSEALKRLLHMGVDDAIYEWLPFGYKTFFKSGPFTVPMKELSEHFKFADADTRSRRIYNDLVDLVVASVTPTNVTPNSQGLCAHYPFLHHIIDFDKLKQFDGTFRMNSYCIDTGTMEQFDKNEIGPEHFYASLSFPFIYPPARIKDKFYYEGAAFDPLNLPTYHRQCRKSKIKVLVVIDVLTPYRKALVRRPRHLVDAYGISIMMPVVALAIMDFKDFMNSRRAQKRAGGGGSLYTLRRLRFKVAKRDYEVLCEWSYSNLHRQWDIGYTAGFSFGKRFKEELPDHMPDSPDPVP